jgi:hypothetical protein
MVPFAPVPPAIAATPEDLTTCQHFKLIARTDIAHQGVASPDNKPPQDICIPRGYFRTAGPTITDLAITAKWPSMESIWDKPLPGRTYDPETHGNLLNIWFARATSFTSVDYRFHAIKRLIKADLPGVPQFGLQHLIPDPTNPRPVAELYFLPEQTHTAYIECTVPSYAPFPGCEETFDFQGYLISVHYSYVFLPKWKEIEENVGRLILSFEIRK